MMKYCITWIFLFASCRPVASRDSRLQNTEGEVEVIYESKFCELLKSSKCDDYEASGISFYDNRYFVVFDNKKNFLMDIKIKDEYIPKSASELKINTETEFGYEGIDIEKSTGLIKVLEENKKVNSDLVGVFYENDKKLANQNFKSKILNEGEFNFSQENKGYEGIASLKGDLNEYTFLLCEGNYCAAGKHKDDNEKVGHGRLHLYVKSEQSWMGPQEIPLDDYIKDFKDYSGIDIFWTKKKNNYWIGNMAISSQENGAIWIGVIEFDEEDKTVKRIKEEKVLKLKKSYCNIEGVTWVDNPSNRLLAIVSDKAKSNQDEKCEKKDQSIHILKY